MKRQHESAQSLEEAKRQLREAQDSAAAEYTERYIAKVRALVEGKFRDAKGMDERQKVVEGLEQAVSMENLALGMQVIGGEDPAGMRFIDLEAMPNLSEVLYRAITYKRAQYTTDDKLAQWLERSRQTAYRLRDAAKAYEEGNRSALKGVDLRSGMSIAREKRKD